jgi:dienelactone hydrolase
MKEQEFEFVSAGRTFTGFVSEPGRAKDGSTRPGVLVLHGGAGLGPHERERAGMLAELGYVAFAPDLFGETFSSREQGIATIKGLVDEPSTLRSRLADALAWLRARPDVDGKRAAAIGFCFGGLAALELARSGADLRAVVSFHGGLAARAPARPGEVRAAILVCTGAADPFVTREHRSAFENEMTAAGADWQVQVYGGAMHGFTERAPGEQKPQRPGVQYHAAADRRSWQAMRALFDETLA